MSSYLTLEHFSTATLHEAAGRIGNLPSAIKPVAPEMSIWGPAFPVQASPNDNYWIHQAIYEAASGDVLVIATGEGYESGYWGEIMTRAAVARNLGGVVLDGGARDGDRLREIGFPVFTRGLCIRGTVKDHPYGGVGSPVSIGDAEIRRGDLVVGDVDGVVVIPAERVLAVLELSDAREKKEAAVMAALERGETTLSLYGLAPMGK